MAASNSTNNSSTTADNEIEALVLHLKMAFRGLMMESASEAPPMNRSTFGLNQAQNNRAANTTFNRPTATHELGETSSSSSYPFSSELTSFKLEPSTQSDPDMITFEPEPSNLIVDIDEVKPTSSKHEPGIQSNMMTGSSATNAIPPSNLFVDFEEKKQKEGLIVDIETKKEISVKKSVKFSPATDLRTFSSKATNIERARQFTPIIPYGFVDGVEKENSIPRRMMGQHQQRPRSYAPKTADAGAVPSQSSRYWQQPSRSRSRSRLDPSQIIVFGDPKEGSRLKVAPPLGHSRNFFRLSKQPAHGYTEENAHQAMESFLNRKLLVVNKTKVFEPPPEISKWDGPICHKHVTVPCLNVARVRFQGKGFTEEEAERNCELMIVKELFDFDAVKEAAIELYSGDRKKELLDPTRQLDLKLSAWLNSSTKSFLQKMKEIEAKKDVFEPAMAKKKKNTAETSLL